MDQRRLKYVLADDGTLTLGQETNCRSRSFRRLRVRGTGVGDLSEFGEEIERLFSRGERLVFSTPNKDR